MTSNNKNESDEPPNAKGDVEQGVSDGTSSPTTEENVETEQTAATPAAPTGAAAVPGGAETRSARRRRFRRLRRRRLREKHKERRTSQGLLFWEQAIEHLNNEELHPDMSVSLRHHRTAELEELDPPLTKSEMRRDRMLETIANNKWILTANIFVLFLVVAVGALWFFFVLGWQTLCTPRTDCQPRNTVYNISIHIMTGLFTWMSTIVMPWRWAHTLHTLGWSKPRRSNDVGHDLYGLSTDDPWFHVPKQKRTIILFFLMFNCFFQFANQVCRGIYWSYSDADSFPGNFWTNIWFVLSIVWAVIGALLFWKHTSIVRETDKERFGPGPIEMIQDMYVAYQKRRRGEEDDEDDEEDEKDSDDNNEEGSPPLPSIEEVSPSQEIDTIREVSPTDNKNDGNADAANTSAKENAKQT